LHYIYSVLAANERKIIPALLSCIVTSLVFTGCRQTIPSLPENEAVVSQLCQVKQQLRIGFYSGPNVVILDPCNTDANRSITFVTEPPRAFSTYDYASDRSPDGEWLAKAGEHELELWNQLTAKSRVAVRATKLLTPPRWSPDSNFVFLVTSENFARKRPFSSCGMDDISEVYAVNAHSGNGTIVGRVCAGVPVDRFRWLQ